jgi:hypothetical protein
LLFTQNGADPLADFGLAAQELQASVRQFRQSTEDSLAGSVQWATQVHLLLYDIAGRYRITVVDANQLLIITKAVVALEFVQNKRDGLRVIWHDHSNRVAGHVLKGRIVGQSLRVAGHVL